MSPTRLKILVSENFNSFIACGFSSEKPYHLETEHWLWRGGKEKNQRLFFCVETLDSRKRVVIHIRSWGDVSSLYLPRFLMFHIVVKMS